MLVLRSLLILPIISITIGGIGICHASAFFPFSGDSKNAVDSNTRKEGVYPNEVRFLGLTIYGIAEQLPLTPHPSPLTQKRRDKSPSLQESSLPPKIAQNNRVQIQLTVHKLVERQDETGEIEREWLELPPQASVSPGDVVRYTIAAENQSNAEVRNFNLTQPIPPQMVYVPDSVTGENGAEITYSIDNGETFTANPTVTVTLEDGSVTTESAPPDTYTHLRWTFVNPLPPATTVTGQFQVRVK